MLKSLFNAIDISASGLSAERTRLTVISENIANAETTRTPEGGPYRRKIAIFESGVPGKKFSEIFYQNELEMKQTDDKHKPDEPFKEVNQYNKKGVHVSDIIKDPSPFRMVYDPYHPDANGEGYVAKPNVNIVQEMTELISSTKTFEANATALTSSKDMIRKSFKI